MTEVSYGDLIKQQFFAPQQAAVANIDEDPEKAARSVELEGATGVPAAAIHGDVEGFERQHKAALASRIIANNHYLQDYANADPMHAKVSSDDWAQLDTVSDHIQRLMPPAIGKAFVAPTSIMDRALKAFTDTIKEQPASGSWMLKTQADLDYARDHPWVASALRLAGQPVEMLNALFGASMAAVGEGTSAAAQHAGASEQSAKKLGQDIQGMVEQHLMGLSGVHTPHIPPEVGHAIDAVNAARPWIAAGKEPPPGVHPLIDQIHHEQAKIDVKNLDDALKEAQKSATGQRSPEILANFIRSHTEAKIGVSAEAVRKLYGDVEPTVEDGKLGWVPDIVQQLRAAEAAGGDVEIPLADWLTKVSPEVAKELHDDVRVRPGGVTLNEAKELKTPTALEPLAQEEPKASPAVQALRSAAKLDPILEKVPEGWEKAEGFEPKIGEIIPITDRVSARMLTEKELTPDNLGEMQKVNEVLDRLVPRLVRHAPVAEVTTEGRRLGGIYQPFRDRLPLILWSIERGEPTARHEAIHHLRQYGFFKDEEWALLERTALKEDWIGKHNIDERYRGKSIELRLEESIAEEFRDWSKDVEQPHTVGKIFDKLRELLDKIKSGLRQVFGREPTAQDLFLKVEKGEIGARRGIEPLRESYHYPAMAEELPEAERPLFEKAAAIGMTVKQYKKYQKLIAERAAEDVEAQTRAASKDIAKRQTKEWKENEAKVLDQVSEEIKARPDIASDIFLREGKLYGQQLAAKPRLDADVLTAEQKAELHPHHYGKEGVHPDDVAGLFGYQSGEAMINRLRMLEQARKAAGRAPGEYLGKLIADETERRMRKEFGDLDENILTEAKDHVISQTQMDLLHEEVVALGTKAHGKISITKDALKSWVKQSFDGTPISAHSTDKYLRQAGKSGAAAEAALLDGDFAAAFKAKQQQYLSMLLANEAKKLEKAKDQFDRTAKRFSKREVPGIEPEYTNFIHDILMRVGKPVRRSVQDLQEAIARGEQKTLEDFVEYKQQHDMREVPVAEFLYDQSFRKNLDDLTAAEFKAVHDSIKTLVKNGRDEQKLIREGEERDLAELRKQMIDQISTLPERKIEASPKKGILYTLRTYGMSSLMMESILNRLDRGDPKGVLSQWIMRPLVEGANYEAKLRRKYSQEYRDLGKFPDRDAVVDNPNLFLDPLDGTAIRLTRKNLRAILANVGNASNLDKLARGYKIDNPDLIMAWLFRNTTKADWDWAQKQGDIFGRIKKEADTMYRGLSGVEPEGIEIKPINTPFGIYSGWYHPIIFHPVWEGGSKKLMGGDPLEQSNYIRATTPAGYTKQRTGYAAPLALDLDMVPVRMQQMLHDIALRPPIINASKMFYNKEFRSAITKHYSEIATKELVPYLKDVANSSNARSEAAWVGNQALEFFRQNIISTLVGFNPGTVFKHGPTAAMNSITEVGPINFAKAVAGLLKVNEETGEKNWAFAMRESEELQRRHSNWIETLGGAHAINFGKNTLRETVMKLGSTPVAISDLLSAVPTWMARYEKAVKEGEEHGTAVDLANTAVRRAHGSTVITNRPALMRGGAMGMWMTSLYGFFSHILNRQYELMWRAGDAISAAKKGDLSEAKRHAPFVMAGLFSYVIFPAMIEEMVSPLTNEEKESWGKWGAKALVRGLSSSWVGVRDIVNAMMINRDPSAGLMSTSGKSVTDLVRDLSHGKEAFNHEHAGNLIQHGATVIGAMTGLTNAQEGRTAKFIYNYATGQEHPRGIPQWWHGLRHGTLKEQRR